jgi:hypothetical protein
MILRFLPGIIAVAVATFAAAGEPKWVTYRSPTEFYSVDHPSDWRVEREENIVNIFPDDDSGAVTISAYVGETAPGFAEHLISESFATHQPLSPLLTVTGSGWKGVRRTFLDNSSTPNHELVVMIATNANGIVIITWNEASPRIADWAPVYTRIFQSLRLSTPKRR